jgi:hypothetical protein
VLSAASAINNRLPAMLGSIHRLAGKVACLLQH